MLRQAVLSVFLSDVWALCLRCELVNVFVVNLV